CSRRPNHRGIPATASSAGDPPLERNPASLPPPIQQGKCGLDLTPSLADLFIRDLSHSITARYFSSNPSDSGSLRTPCPPASKPAGRRGITPAFGYSAPHPSAGGTLTLLIHALPSAHYEPLRPPKAPSLSLAGFRLVIADHALGLPVLRALSFCTCRRHYPGAASGRTLRPASPSRISLPRKGCRVGLRIVLFEDC